MTHASLYRDLASIASNGSKHALQRRYDVLASSAHAVIDTSAA